ncbi:hypothetical protein CC77DRAFT_1004931 [Alternaria alternata]|uniref:Rhodopsin domain-containing protein n=1 Tax=Alternaria alternata TaxID=5599 RepID=A0A177E052_ALTAL|nr:hypothetical protein CC77DRAFT_1004931 [Alternaria alternata]OAG25307.1 hypothetical protein CC77DRAFT_1004931 [Alternaria alternata]
MNNLPPISDADIAYSNASNLMVQAGTIFGIALAITLLRCYTLAIIAFGCYVAKVPLGPGKHLAVIQLDQPRYRQLLKVRLVHQICVTAGMTVVKISSQNKLTVLQLRPPPMGTGGALCLSVSTFSQIALFNSIVNIATDFLLALLPIPVIFNLQVRIRIKIMLALVLSLGIFASVAGIMKAHLDVGILAASLPTLRPPFNRFLEAARSVVQSQPTTTPRFSFREPGSLGYAKQTYEFGEVLELGQYKVGCETTVRVSSRLPEGHDARSWRLDKAHNSESIMPPIHGYVSHSKDILVTKDISIFRLDHAHQAEAVFVVRYASEPVCRAVDTRYVRRESLLQEQGMRQISVAEGSAKHAHRIAHMEYLQRTPHCKFHRLSYQSPGCHRFFLAR